MPFVIVEFSWLYSTNGHRMWFQNESNWTSTIKNRTREIQFGVSHLKSMLPANWFLIFDSTTTVFFGVFIFFVFIVWHEHTHTHWIFGTLTNYTVEKEIATAQAVVNNDCMK